MASGLPYGKGRRPPKQPAAGVRGVLGRTAGPLRLASPVTVHRWWAACALFLALALAAGVLTGLVTGLAGARAAEGEAAARHRVTATAVADAQYTHTDTSSPTTVRAVWHHPDTSRHTARVEAPPETARGDRVEVWVDGRGNAVRPPRTTMETVAWATAAGAGATVVVLMAGGAVGLARLRAVEARQLAAWEREWERVEPHWSGRGPEER